MYIMCFVYTDTGSTEKKGHLTTTAVASQSRATTGSHAPTTEEKGHHATTAVASQSKATPAYDLEAISRHVRSQQYDVFLSFAEEDKEFAEEMRSRLVSHAKLRVIVPSDGMSSLASLPNQRMEIPYILTCI